MMRLDRGSTLFPVILRCALLRASKDDRARGPSFEARPAVQVHRKARTSSDNGEAVAQG